MVRNEFGFGYRIAQAKPRVIVFSAASHIFVFPARSRSLFFPPRVRLSHKKNNPGFIGNSALPSLAGDSALRAAVAS